MLAADLWNGEPASQAELGFSDEVWRAVAKLGAQGDAKPELKQLHKSAARLLASIIIAENVQVAAELGAYTGYSTLYLAAALAKTGGHLWTYEKFKDRAALAGAALGQAGLSELVTLTVADGVQALAESQASIDLIFMDIWPADYKQAYLNARLRLHAGSIIIADNMMTHRDTAGNVHSADSSGAPEFQQFMANLPDCESTVLDLGSGLLVAQLQRPS